MFTIEGCIVVNQDAISNTNQIESQSITNRTIVDQIGTTTSKNEPSTTIVRCCVVDQDISISRTVQIESIVSMIGGDVVDKDVATGLLNSESTNTICCYVACQIVGVTITP